MRTRSQIEPTPIEVDDEILASDIEDGILEVSVVDETPSEEKMVVDPPQSPKPRGPSPEIGDSDEANINHGLSQMRISNERFDFPNDMDNSPGEPTDESVPPDPHAVISLDEPPQTPPGSITSALKQIYRDRQPNQATRTSTRRTSQKIVPTDESPLLDPLL